MATVVLFRALVPTPVFWLAPGTLRDCNTPLPTAVLAQQSLFTTSGGLLGIGRSNGQQNCGADENGLGGEFHTSMTSCSSVVIDVEGSPPRRLRKRISPDPASLHVAMRLLPCS